MKRVISLLLALCLILSLCACGQKAETTWQEQYDLGMRYLSEGNYEEAVIAFEAAIEIDQKQAEAYIGLADTYIALGDTDAAIAVLNDALDTIDETSAIHEKLNKLASQSEPDTNFKSEPDSEIDNESDDKPDNGPTSETSEEYIVTVTS